MLGVVCPNNVCCVYWTLGADDDSILHLDFQVQMIGVLAGLLAIGGALATFVFLARKAHHKKTIVSISYHSHICFLHLSV